MVSWLKGDSWSPKTLVRALWERRVAVLLGAAVAVAATVAKGIRRSRVVSRIVARKGAERDAAFAEASKIVAVWNTPITRKEILELSVTDLVKMMGTCRISAVDVLTVYLFAAVEAQRDTNCFTDLFTTKAMQAAAQLDEHLARTGCIAGPLHGVPVTVKDCIDVEGADTTLGFIHRCFRPAAADATVVQRLRAAGAVILGKTNVPQALSSWATFNAIFGETRNPLDVARCPGGSSGGEAAALAALGVGTDIGGSVRIPAAMCEVFSLRPTAHRIERVGAHGLNEAQEGVPSVIGPMARSVHDLELLASVVFNDDFPFSHFNSGSVSAARHSETPLRVGYYTDDGLIPISPPCRRAVEAVVEALRAGGHGVEEIPAASMPTLRAFCTYTELVFGADGGRGLRAAAATDELAPVLRRSMDSMSLHPLFARLVGFLFRKVDPALGEILRSLTSRPSVYDYYQILARRNQLRLVYDSLFASYDFVIAPAFAVPAPLLSVGDMAGVLCQTPMLFNLLDLPVVTIPIQTVVILASDATEWAELCDASPNRVLVRDIRPTFDAGEVGRRAVGTAIQLISKRGHDESAIGYADFVSNLLRCS